MIRTHDISEGLEPAIIRLILDHKDDPKRYDSDDIMPELDGMNLPQWAAGVDDLIPETKRGAHTKRAYVEFVRRIVRQTLGEQRKREAKK